MATLFCKSQEELIEYLSLDKPFQTKIIYQNLIKGVTRFDQMTSLPRAMRERLSAKHVDAMSSTVIKTSEAESATKLAIRLEDGMVVECVRLSDGQGRYTACVSSQVGCAMGCVFCCSGENGLVRHLTAGEMLGEIIFANKLLGPLSANTVESDE